MSKAEELLDTICKRSSKWRKVLAICLIFLTIHGTVGFAMFVCEEAMQTAMFGAFSYQNAKDWEGLLMHVQVMKSVHATGTVVIKYFGWLAPVMYIPYLKYLESNQAFIEAMEIRANQYVD